MAMYVLVLIVEINDTKGLTIQNVVEANRYIMEHNLQGTDFLIFCKIGRQTQKPNMDTYREEIKLLVEKQLIGHDISSERMIHDEKELTLEISNCLVDRIITVLTKLCTHLNRFVRLNICSNTDIDTHSMIIDVITEFIDEGFVDMMSVTTDGNEWTDACLKTIARQLKCKAVDNFSANYRISSEICNKLAIFYRIEEAFAGAVSNSNRYHFVELKKAYQNSSGNRQPNRIDRFKLLPFLIGRDVHGILQPLQTHLEEVKKVSEFMRKMIFEIEGYCTQLKPPMHAKTSNNVLPDKIRGQLLKMEGVLGFGTIYHERAIHVTHRKSKEAVENLLSENKIYYANVRVIDQPTPLVHIKPGGKIQCPKESTEHVKTSTLGLFACNEHQEMYALTCAHIFKCRSEGTCCICIDTGPRGDTFATYCPQMAVLLGEEPFAIIDIAALKVNDDMTSYCTRVLEDSDGIQASAVLSTNITESYIGRYVYKHGATTGCTEGIICAVDYILLSTDNHECLVLVDCLPGYEKKALAQPGDSGSVFCLTNVANNMRTIEVISMLTSGGSLCMSFPLLTGLKEIEDRSGVKLVLCEV